MVSCEVKRWGGNNKANIEAKISADGLGKSDIHLASGEEYIQMHF